MLATRQVKRINVRTATEPQIRFWAAPERFVALVGGVGSGKSWAGAVKCLKMPPRSTGMVLAPTYPMLRDATLRTFLTLAQQWGALARFHKSEYRAELINGTTVLFRSADNPDRLRGPNLGWFWLDEAALMKRDVWLIMLGRLREQPAVAWATTTPRGKNWLYSEFVRGAGDHRIVKASSRSNPFNPDSFVDSMARSYGETFARQEIEGEFIDDQSDALLPGDWLDRAEVAGRQPWKRFGNARLPIDLGGGDGGDRTVLMPQDDSGVLDLEHSRWWNFPATAKRAAANCKGFGIASSRVTYDRPGIGHGFGSFLVAEGIEGAHGYAGGSTGGPRFANARSAGAWMMRLRMDPDQPDQHGNPQPPFAIRPEHMELMREELAGLKWTINNDRRIALQSKEEYAAELGHSPDFADTLCQRFFHLN